MSAFELHRQPNDCMVKDGCRFSIFKDGELWLMFDTVNPIDNRLRAQAVVDALNAAHVETKVSP